MKIKNWYVEAYPTDELGAEIDSKVSFKDLQEALKTSECVYSVIGVDDSLVRERVFYKLSTILKVGYDTIYNQWLKVWNSIEFKEVLIMVKLYYLDNDSKILIGEILTSQSITVDQAINFINFNEQHFIEDNNFDDIDYNCFYLEY